MVKLATSQKEVVRTQYEDRVNGFPIENELRDLRFKLSHNLQSTLHLQTTLELFFENTQDLVPTCGMRYESKKSGIEIFLGQQEKHSAAYNVSSPAAKLGHLTFYRDTPYVESELAFLEMLIGILFYPLRNALLYREALELSMRDPLTGIGNRKALDLSFGREIKLSKRHAHPLSLMIIDIDHFKQINDDLGHQTGDKVLQKTVKIIQNALRETDQIFRYGGEEFVVLLNNTDIDGARVIAERIRLNVAMTPITLKDEDILITISLGISESQKNDAMDDLFYRADKALYEAKQTGRNKVCHFDNMAKTA